MYPAGWGPICSRLSIDNIVGKVEIISSNFYRIQLSLLNGFYSRRMISVKMGGIFLAFLPSFTLSTSTSTSVVLFFYVIVEFVSTVIDENVHRKRK